MKTERVKILSNKNINKDYYHIVLESKDSSCNIQAGQFAHLQIKNSGEKLFRRPFSVFNTDPGKSLSIIYKVVGFGTKILSELKVGENCDIIAPLGNGYSPVGEDSYPVIITGGYGSAATYILAKESRIKGVALIGAKTKNDLILLDEYRSLGFEVIVATDDGSIGHNGFVTDLLIPYLEGNRAKIYGCGPNPMMYKIVSMLKPYKKIAELSFDHHMCCGVGACFGCVLKIKSDNEKGWIYSRTCEEGPVFSSNTIFTESLTIKK